LRRTEDIGGDDFRSRGDTGKEIERIPVQKFAGSGRRETNQTDRGAIAAKHGSLTAMMLAARAVRHLALLVGKLKNVCRGRERPSINFCLSDQRQDYGAY
jgi:hypothetical protein